jgi:hypothetical protein
LRKPPPESAGLRRVELVETSQSKCCFLENEISKKRILMLTKIQNRFKMKPIDSRQ